MDHAINFCLTVFRRFVDFVIYFRAVIWMKTCFGAWLFVCGGSNGVVRRYFNRQFFGKRLFTAQILSFARKNQLNQRNWLISSHNKFQIYDLLQLFTFRRIWTNKKSASNWRFNFTKLKSPSNWTTDKGFERWVL